MPHNRDASHDIPPAAPPSAEVLVEAARQVASAYPALFAHQRTGVAFLLSRRRAILADDMGLGKSRQAIVALRESAPAGPYLVVCPAGVKLNWQREIALVEPTPDVHVVHSSREWRSGHRWTVVNYDLLGRLQADLQSVSWAGIVVDEAHYIKNDSARTTNVLRLLGADGRGSQQPVTRVLVGNLHAAATGITLTAATHVVFNDLDWVPGNHWQAEDRIYRIGQTRPAFATYLYAAQTLDDFVAALLEAKARNIGVLETTAAESASLVEQVVDAAVRGERPREPGVRGNPAQVATDRSVGLLEDTLDLLARMRRGLASVDGSDERVFQVPSKSNPGSFNTVTVMEGVARCSCEGFAYRGNCSHAQRIASRLARGAA